MAKVNWSRICEADDRRRVKALSDDEAFGQMLMGTLASQKRRTVMRRRPRSVTAMPDEIALSLVRVGPAAAVIRRCEQGGPFTVEINQFLGNGPAFRGIGVQ